MTQPMRKKKLQTFPRYLEVECWKFPDLRGLEPVLQAVADACKQINRIVQRAQTDDVYGVAVDADGNPLEETNIQGEVQQKLDVLANTIMLRAFCGSGGDIHSVASEEEDVPRSCADVMVREGVIQLVGFVIVDVCKVGFMFSFSAPRLFLNSLTFMFLLVCMVERMIRPLQ